jgi:hypothetical protein
MVRERDANWLVSAKRRTVIWQAGVLLYCDTGKDKRLFHAQ